MKIAYFLIVSSMIGTNIFSLNVGAFQLSFFRGAMILLLLVSIIEVLIKNRKIKLLKNQEDNFSIKFMFFWFAYAIFTLAWVKDYIGWIKAIFFIGLGLLSILFLKKYIKNRYDVLKSMYLIVYMVLFHNILGWYEIITSNYLFLREELVELYRRFGYPVSTFGNTNDYALFLMFAVFILYICIVNTSNILKKMFFLALILSSASLIVISGSRSVIIGMIFALLILVFYSTQRKITRRVVVTLILGAFLFILVRPNIIGNIIFNVDNILAFDFARYDSSEFVRMNLVRNGILFLISTYGFGVGAGNIEYWMSNYSKHATSGVVNIHNWWMELLVGYGIVIFILYIIYYFKLINSMRKKFKTSSNKTDVTLSLGFMCIMFGYIVASLSSSSDLKSEWLWVFWALIVVYQGLDVTTNEALSANLSHKKEKSKNV